MISISKASIEELIIVKNLAYKIWPHAYSSILSKEQLNYMLDKFYSLDSLKNQFDNDNHVFLLVKENEEFLGFASYELNSESNSKAKLHKLYVLPNLHGKGIGKLLINEIQKIAKNNNQKSIFLNVNRFNPAKDFYLKLGFKIIDSIDISIGNNFLMEDFIMEKKL